MIHRAGLAALAVLALLSKIAQAGPEQDSQIAQVDPEREPQSAQPDPERDRPTESEDTASPPVRTEAPKPWLYVDDTTVAAPREVLASTRVTAAGGDSTTRPFASNSVRTGAGFEVGVEAGLVPTLSIAASAMLNSVRPNDQRSAFGVMGGLRFAPFQRLWPNTHLIFSAGGLRESGGNGGLWGRVTLGQDIGRARVAVTGHGEHIVEQGRDSVDIMLMGGASYQVYGPLRLGAEYVAQDVEGAFDDDEAEGGIRHFIGPTGSVELLSQRLTIVGGPSFGLSSGSPPVVGRIGVAYAF